jgi:hypothetical protein
VIRLAPEDRDLILSSRQVNRIKYCLLLLEFIPAKSCDVDAGPAATISVPGHSLDELAPGIRAEIEATIGCRLEVHEGPRLEPTAAPRFGVPGRGRPRSSRRVLGHLSTGAGQLQLVARSHSLGSVNDGQPRVARSERDSRAPRLVAGSLVMAAMFAGCTFPWALIGGTSVGGLLLLAAFDLAAGFLAYPLLRWVRSRS